MSEIRNLIASAQEAELAGKKDEAVRLLRKAAEWYRDRQLLKRAAQMLRQARRVEGVEEESAEAVFGFDDADAATDSLSPRGRGLGRGLTDDAEPLRTDGQVLVEQRTPQLADPSLDAWCSFCCKPKSEVGALVAGPAGAFVCASCVSVSAGLLALTPTLSPSGEREKVEITNWEVRALPFELTSQRRARTRFTRARSRLALVIGPEGTGKTAWLRSLGAQPDLRHVELTRTLSPAEEAELLAWLEAPARALFLELRAPVPKPALVLQGEHGDEPLHDTASLVDAITHVSPRLLSRVDAVIPFDHPPIEELAQLARALAEARGITLAEPTLTQLVTIAQRAQRGAHELATLIARIPPGKYGA